MRTTFSCPPTDFLRRLLGDAVPAPEQAGLIAHLDACSSCQEKLEKLAGADSAWLDAARDLCRTSYLEEEPLRRMLEHLETDVTLNFHHRPGQRAARVRTLLQPAESLAILGQLEDYQVTDLIGQGGMGLVLKAFQPTLKRWVAIKVLSPDLAGDPLSRQRFAREAQAAAAVRHRHVITIHAVSEANGLPFIVMEYVAGGSLQDYLDTHGPPDWRAAARLGAEIAAGLTAAHARGLVHRDIKPSNVLLQSDGDDSDLGSARISDFGVARVADESRLTRTGFIPGTPMYMSPEQALCEPVDERADLFSLGSLLYTLCTGYEPFAAGSPVAVLRQVCEATPRPIRDLNREIPVWLADLVERLHAKRREDRFASAAEVEEILTYDLAHPDSPRTLPPRQHGRWLLRSKYFLAATTGVITLLLIAGMALGHALGWIHWFIRDPVPLQAVLRGHEGPVWSVAVSPDGHTLATGSDDSTVRLWDLTTGNEIAVLHGHNGPVQTVLFAHSGKFLLSGGNDGTLRRWDLNTSKELAKPSHVGVSLRRISLSPDDRTVAVGSSDQTVELWDLEHDRVRQTLSGLHGTIWAIALAPDGRTLAAGDATGQIHLWDYSTGAPLASFQGDPLGLRALAFSPDTQTLASAGTGDRGVKLWNLTTQTATVTLRSDSEMGILNVAFSPDGRFLAAGCRDGMARIWEVSSARLLATINAHKGSVWGLAFSPDGRKLATVGENRLGKLWDIEKLRH